MNINYKIKSMSKRANWQYEVFLSSPQKRKGFPLTPDWLPHEERLDFGPDYGVNHEK